MFTELNLYLISLSPQIPSGNGWTSRSADTLKITGETSTLQGELPGALRTQEQRGSLLQDTSDFYLFLVSEPDPQLLVHKILQKRASLPRVLTHRLTRGSIRCQRQ